MANEVMSTLFGVTPEALMAQRAQQDMARGIQLAQLDPFQQASANIYAGSAGLTRAVGGLLGAGDPLMVQAGQRKSLLQETDLTDPQSLRQAALSARQSGDLPAALQLAQRAMDVEQAQAKITADTALAAQRTRERQAADPFQQFLRSAVGKVTPESLAKYQESGNVADLEWTEKPEKPKSFGADAERIAKALFGTDYDKLSPQQAATVNQKLVEQETQVRASGAPKISVTTAQETAFAKERGQLQAKALSEAETQAKASANAVNRLANMEKLNQGAMLTGPLAGTAIGAGQFLSSLGLLSADSAKTLSSSEIYDKQAKDLVMQDLGGKLGAQISNADREFIEARIPQLRNSQQARTELIAKLKEIHKKNIDYYQRMSKHANTKGNLNDFDFSSGAPDTAETPKSTQPTQRWNPVTKKLEPVGG